MDFIKAVQKSKQAVCFLFHSTFLPYMSHFGSLFFALQQTTCWLGLAPEDYDNKRLCAEETMKR